MPKIQTLVDEFSALDATATSSEYAIALHVLKSLKGYRGFSTHLGHDVEYLEAALQAYAKLLQDLDVKVVP